MRGSGGRGMAARLRIALAVFASSLSGCAGERAWQPRCDAALERLVAAADAAPPPRAGFIDWAALRNPLLALEDRSVKDQAVVHADGRFFVFSSMRFPPDLPEAERIPQFFHTRDFRRFEPFGDPDLLGPGRGPGSPDVVREGGLWHMVFQTESDGGGGGARTLALSTSRDLLDWSPPRPLAPGILDPRVRNIDGALAKAGGHYFLGWKRDQSLFVTRSAGSELDGRWLAPRHANAALAFGPSALSHDWAENYQFLEIDGAWHMLATGRAPGLPFSRHVYTGSHAPYLYRMDGSGEQLEDWTRWVCKRRLEIPREAWNGAMHANSAFLADWRRHDGYFYLFYAGSADHESFDRRGHGKIGAARSRDLVRWRLPGDPRP